MPLPPELERIKKWTQETDPTANLEYETEADWRDILIALTTVFVRTEPDHDLGTLVAPREGGDTPTSDEG